MGTSSGVTVIVAPPLDEDAASAAFVQPADGVVAAVSGSGETTCCEAVAGDGEPDAAPETRSVVFVVEPRVAISAMIGGPGIMPLSGGGKKGG